MPVDPPRSAPRVLAVGGPLVLSALLGVVRDDVDRAPAVLALVLVVVAVAAVGDRLAGVLAALAATAGFDVFLTQPYLSLVIVHPADVELAVALGVVGLSVSELALRGRRAHAASARREGYLSGVAALLDLPEGSTGEDRGQALARAVAEVVGVDRVRWSAGPPDRRDAVVEDDGTLVVDGQVLRPARDGLPTDREVCLLARHDGEVVGFVALTAASRVVRPSEEQLRVAALLVRVAGHLAPRAPSPRPGHRPPDRLR